MVLDPPICEVRLERAIADFTFQRASVRSHLVTWLRRVTLGSFIE